MRRKQKTTRRVRIKLDFVVEMDRDLSTLPFGGPEIAAMMLVAAANSLKGRGVVAYGAPFSFGVYLDHRKPKAEPESAAADAAEAAR